MHHPTEVTQTSELDQWELSLEHPLEDYIQGEYPQRSKRLDSFASFEDPRQSCSFQWAPMQAMEVSDHQILWEQEREHSHQPYLCTRISTKTGRHDIYLTLDENISHDK
ncbi:hypothetical protein Tco_1500140 [Tanacetum coccineum]